MRSKKKGQGRGGREKKWEGVDFCRGKGGERLYTQKCTLNMKMFTLMGGGKREKKRKKKASECLNHYI